MNIDVNKITFDDILIIINSIKNKYRVSDIESLIQLMYDHIVNYNNPHSVEIEQLPEQVIDVFYETWLSEGYYGTKEDFINILTIPQNAITTQYSTLLAVDNIDLQFTRDAIDKIAEISAFLNATSEDIGARRLHTVMENLIEDISFNAGGDIPLTQVVIDKKYVDDHLNYTDSARNLKKYIL